MESYTLQRTEIVNVVRNSLSKIDPRLIDHGERVAYIATKIYQNLVDPSAFNFTKLFMLCVLHDIGAYKTDEIDDMVVFETNHTFQHTLYGYLFLKNTAVLSDCADAILYHHTDYIDLLKKPVANSTYAELIYFADRVDILLHSRNKDLSILRAMSGKNFNPLYVEAFMSANATGAISSSVLSEEYRKEIDETIATLDIKNEDILEYLILLVYAIDFRSPYTVTHTADTTIISLETAKLLQLSEHDLEAIYIGAILHDIGKIAIPQSILEKPGKLTTEEFDIVKTHIQEGEHILRGVISDEICDIALRHHEKLNGSGYMRGLSAEKLSIPQRIVAVADIVSALSQRRSYKEPFPKEKVISILLEMKNDGLLCPLVVDTVCNNYDFIMKNTEKSHDPIKSLYINIQNEYNKLTALH